MLGRLYSHVHLPAGLSLRPWQTRTHCCGHIVVDTNVSLFARARNNCCGHKKFFWFCSKTFCVRNKCFPVCTRKETSWATMFPQQCFRNNVSLFATAFKFWVTCCLNVLHTLGKLVTLWLNSINNRHFHPWHQGKIKHTRAAVTLVWCYGLQPLMINLTWVLLLCNQQIRIK